MTSTSTLRDDVRNLLDANATTPLDAFDKVRAELAKSTAQGGRCDPLASDRQRDEAMDAYYLAANTFEQSGLFPAAESLLVEWWNSYGIRQYNEKVRVYRAGLAFKLTEHYIKRQDKGTALRWCLLTQADDILGQHPDRGGAGRHQLRTLFGMTDVELDELNRIADKCRDEVVTAHGGDWSIPAAFAEEVVRRFALQSNTGAHLIGYAGSGRDFPISSGYFQSRLDLVHSTTLTGTDKGDALEDLACYLFLLLPGCMPQRKVLSQNLAFESDVVVHNLNQMPNLTAELFGRHFLSECKNWEKPVNVNHVGYFLYRMRLTHASFGVIFAKSGITGDDNGNAARDLLRMAFHEDSSVCVVVDDNDLLALASGKQTFWWMLLSKIQTARFGKPS